MVQKRRLVGDNVTEGEKFGDPGEMPTGDIAKRTGVARRGTKKRNT